MAGQKMAQGLRGSSRGDRNVAERSCFCLCVCTSMDIREEVFGVYC